MTSLLALVALSLPATLQITVDGAEDGEVLASFGTEHVVRVGEFVLWLDESHPWKLTSVPDGKTAHRTLALMEGDQPVAARLDVAFGLSDGGERVRLLVNPLADRKDLRSLRGLLIGWWDSSFASVLSKTDGAHLCVTSGSTESSRKIDLPRLPRAVPCLVLESSSDPVLAEYSDIATLTRLRYAHFFVDGEELDAAWLSPSVEALRLSWVKLRHPEALSKLASLRTLEVSGVEDLRFGTFPALTTLTIGALKKPLSLASLVAPKLKRVDVSRASLTALPPSLPALERLTALAAGLSPESAKAFARAHPKAAVVTSWKDALRAAIAGATRVRVRSGGLCHTDPSKEQTLVELTRPVEIAALVAAMAIDEARSDGFCMCCGQPTLEFYKGDQLLAAVGMQHGGALRWEGWPADGTLVDERLVQLLARHGVDAPLKEVEAERRRAAARVALEQKYKRLLPPRVAQALDSGAPAEQFPSLLEAAVPDPAARVVVLLRVYGVRTGPWRTQGGLDSVVETALKTVEPKLLASVLATKDEEVLRGAEKYVLGGHQVELARDPATAAAVLTLARRGMVSQWPENRWATLVVLSPVQTDGTTAVLRDVLRGKLAAPAAKAPTEADDSEWIRFSPDPLVTALEGFLARRDAGVASDGGVVDVRRVSERALAALMLASRKDAASLDAIRELAKSMTDLDGVVVRAALKLLTEP